MKVFFRDENGKEIKPLFRKDRIFGRILYYPENELAERLCDFMGLAYGKSKTKKSLTEDQLKALTELGVSVKYQI